MTDWFHEVARYQRQSSFLAGEAWTADVRLFPRSWYERVSTHFSIEDHPSRLAISELLRLRQKRGELEASADGDAPSAGDIGAGEGETAFSKDDLDLLFGMAD